MIKRVSILGILALTLTAVETALLSALGLGGGFYLSLGVLLVAAARAGDIEGAVVAAIIGYGWDLFSGLPVGMSVAPAVAILVVVRVLSQGVEIAGFLQLFILGALCAVLHGACCLGMIVVSGSAVDLSKWYSLGAIVRQGIMAALVAPPVFALGEWLDKMLVKERGELEVWLS